MSGCTHQHSRVTAQIFSYACNSFPVQESPKHTASITFRVIQYIIPLLINITMIVYPNSTSLYPAVSVCLNHFKYELKERKNRIHAILCKRNVYFHNEHIQYIILTNIKSAICIQTTAMYSTKVTAYLNIKGKWLQNCEVTYCDRCHVSATKAFKLTDDMSVEA